MRNYEKDEAMNIGYLILALVCTYLAFRVFGWLLIFGLFITAVFMDELDEGAGLLARIGMGAAYLIVAGLYVWGVYGTVILWRLAIS